MNEENGEDVQQDAAMFLRLRFTARHGENQENQSTCS